MQSPVQPELLPEESKDQPLVSVVMPCYRESLAVIDRTIGSILGQTYTHLELVIVLDDPKNAELLEHLQSLASRDGRVRLLVNARNLGPWGSYNAGVHAARGEMIAIQDADDVSQPERLRRLVAYLIDHPDVDVVGSGIDYVDGASAKVLLSRQYPSDPDHAINRYCPLAHGTTVRWARLHGQHGYYSESDDFRHAADYELWCRWRASGVRMANIPESLYLYYQSDANFKARNVKSILRDTVRIKRKYARGLRFGVLDYLWLAAEAIACVLPAGLVVAAFYLVNGRRSRRVGVA